MVSFSRLVRPATIIGVAVLMVLAASAYPGFGTAQNSPILGTAESFSVLAGSAVTNTGDTVVTGNLGVSPDEAVSGFPPGIVNPPGAIHAGDAVAAQAQSDLTTAYNDLAGRAMTQDLTGQDLGGMTLTPGVYFFESSAQLTGELTLDAQGDPDAEFIFQIGSTLTTESDASVNVINGSLCDVYWQVGSSATLGTDTDFQGNIVALTSITLNTRADIEGRALARNGAVTMDDNVVTNEECYTFPADDDDATPTPTPVPDDDATPTPTPVPDDDATPTPTPVPDDGDGTTPDDDDNGTPPDNGDGTSPDDDNGAPSNGDDGESPAADNGKITLPKTGTAGFLSQSNQRAVAPPFLMAASVLLLIASGVYIRENRHRFE